MKQRKMKEKAKKKNKKKKTPCSRVEVKNVPKIFLFLITVSLPPTCS